MQGRVVRPSISTAAAHGLVVRLQRGQQGHHVHGLARLVAAQAAHELQRLRDHGLHFLEVGLEAQPLLVVVQQVGAQPHAGDRRLQVVRQRGEHARAFVDEGRQALLHGVEGARGLLHLARAVLGQGRAIEVLTQRLGGAGELLQRPHDPAHGHVGQGQHAGQQHGQRQRQPPGQRLRRGRQFGVEAGPQAVAQLHLGAHDGGRGAGAAAHHAAATATLAAARAAVPGACAPAAGQGRHRHVAFARLHAQGPVVAQRGAQPRREHLRVPGRCPPVRPSAAPGAATAPAAAP